MQSVLRNQRVIAIQPYLTFKHQVNIQLSNSQNQNAKYISSRVRRTGLYTRKRFLYTSRCLSQQSISSTEQPAHADPLQGSESTQYSFSIQPNNAKPAKRSQIRQSLRAWSLQNERTKREEVPGTLSYEGKITQLPNALFIRQGLELDQDDIHSRKEIADNETLSENQDEEQCLGGPGTPFLPGTMFLHRPRTGKPQAAAYLGDIGMQSLLLLSDGRWSADVVLHKRMGITVTRGFPVPDFLTPQEVEALKAHMPKQDVKRAVQEDAIPSLVGTTGSLPDSVLVTPLKKFQDFAEAELAFRREYKPKLDRMYESLAYEDKWRVLNIKDLPPLVLGMRYEDMTNPEKSAFIRHTNTFHPSFIGTQTAETVTYYIGPKTHHEDVQLVQYWARSYQEAAALASAGKDVSNMLRVNPLSSFIDKARRLILKSRKIRIPTSLEFLGPALDHSLNEASQKVPSNEVFSAEDKKIIAYLWSLAYRRPASRYSLAHGSLIVRAVGAYPSMQLDLSTYRMMLQELGCVDPWAMYEEISLPLPNTQTMSKLVELNQKVTTSMVLSRDQPNTTAFVDSMAHMRKDWGSMEAISIDLASTTNIEDAFSIEPSIELDGAYWIHVHLSHPTAHLDVDHPIVNYARKRGTAHYSYYEQTENIPMIPSEAINQFSLKANSTVLTISTLLTVEGHVHDIKIVPAIIRNLHCLTRDEVAELLGFEEAAAPEAVLVVGKVSRTHLRIIEKSRSKGEMELERVSQYLPTLELATSLLTARREQRTREVDTPSLYNRLDIATKIHARLPDAQSFHENFESYHWRGDPGIIIKGTRKIDDTAKVTDHRANDLTAQLMRLATESVGKWLHDRKLPAVYLGSQLPNGVSMEQLNQAGLHEKIPTPIYIRKSSAVPFHVIDVMHYTSCTSPTRRFIDMMTHFQIDSYLKAIEKGLIKQNAPVEDDTILSFTRKDVDDYLAQDVAAVDTLYTHDFETRLFWTIQALFRAFHFKEAPLPDILEILVKTPTSRNAMGVLELAHGLLLPWTTRVELEASPEGYERVAKFNQFLPVKIVSVDVPRRIVNVRAVGPPTDTQQHLDPIQAYTSDNFDDKPVRNFSYKNSFASETAT